MSDSGQNSVSETHVEQSVFLLVGEIEVDINFRTPSAMQDFGKNGCISQYNWPLVAAPVRANECPGHNSPKC